MKTWLTEKDSTIEKELKYQQKELLFLLESQSRNKHKIERKSLESL